MDKLSLLFMDRCNEIAFEKNWKSVSKIVGEAAEDCVVTLQCPLCHETSLVKYKTNQKSKDILCEKCGCQIQIKATKHTKNTHLVLSLEVERAVLPPNPLRLSGRAHVRHVRLRVAHVVATLFVWDLSGGFGGVRGC